MADDVSPEDPFPRARLRVEDAEMMEAGPA